jgi:hypothetical protein
MKIGLLFFIITNFLNLTLCILKKEGSTLKKKTENNSKFTFEKFSIDRSELKKFYSRKVDSSLGNEYNQKPSVRRFSSALQQYTNSSFVIKDSNTFKKDNRNWDFKIFDKQLEDIFNCILINQDSEITINGVRSFLQLFLQNYETCDKDKDNVLNQSEFSDCITKDPYLSKITLPIKDPSSPVDFSDPKAFSKELFDLLDERRLSYLNLVDYMKLRLFIFSWRTCNVNGPIIDEVGFECAIDIASGYKTFARTPARKIFQMILEISDNSDIININFFSYVNIASAIRLYGSINGKRNNDIIRSEFNLALDRNTLPDRYNQDIINQIFVLVEEEDREDQGIDIKTFIFLDNALRLFSPDKKKKKFFMTIDEFTMSFKHYLFPSKILNLALQVPQYKITLDSYAMYQGMNITKFSYENDYLGKFLELETNVDKILKFSDIFGPVEKDEPKAGYRTNINSTALKYSAALIFNSSDVNFDGAINFYDYGLFLQIGYIFSKKDEFNKGTLTASVLYDTLISYSEFPSISDNLRKKAQRFFEFNRNINIDLVSAIQILRSEDLVNFFRSSTDNANLNEIDLKRIMLKVNMNFLPNDNLRECLRGVDYRNLPLFDWECSFNKGMKKNLEYFESMNNYQIMKQNNFKLSATAFYNVDPKY